MARWVLLLGLMGCTASTESTEVGVRVDNVGWLGGKGVVPEIYPPGGTYFFLRAFSTWFTFDTALQNLTMLRESAGRGRDGDDSLRFKTVDGNDVSVNVTVSWRIDPSFAPYLAQHVGQSTEEVGEDLVRPVARSVIRDVLNQLSSEAYYKAELRFQMGEEARARLNVILKGEGIVVEQVLLGEHKFNTEYESVIRDKKVAEQEAGRLMSETLAGAEAMKRDLEAMKGSVSKAIEEARGEAEKRKLEADALYYQRDREAQAILAERSAKAKGLTESARAMQGAGGEKAVKLALAEALEGKKIVFVPAGGGMDVRSTDMNALLQQYGILSVSGR